jgi:hypothetical protein
MAAELRSSRASSTNCFVSAVLTAMLLWTGPIDAQSVTAQALKAAFLYNFAKFAEWPADVLAPAQRLSLCVVGDDAVADAIEQIIKGRAVEGHELTVQIVKPEGPLRSCHLLYVGGRDAKRSSQILQGLQNSPVFSVGESDHFAESGGVAQLILEGDRMRFAFNVASIQRARLHVSSKLLALATIVKDAYDARP